MKSVKDLKLSKFLKSTSVTPSLALFRMLSLESFAVFSRYEFEGDPDVSELLSGWASWRDEEMVRFLS